MLTQHPGCENLRREIYGLPEWRRIISLPLERDILRKRARAQNGLQDAEKKPIATLPTSLTAALPQRVASKQVVFVSSTCFGERRRPLGLTLPSVSCAVLDHSVGLAALKDNYARQKIAN